MENYIRLFDHLVERKDSVLKLDEWLKANTDWLRAPASSKFHCHYVGGLIDHSVHVVDTLLKLKEQFAPTTISSETCVIVGLFHDLGKVGLPHKPRYIVENGKYKTNYDMTYLDVPTASLWYLSKFVELTPEEVQAIRQHDGQFVSANEEYKSRECQLAILTHWADYWACRVLDK